MVWVYRFIKQKSQKNIEAWNCEEGWDSRMPCSEIYTACCPPVQCLWWINWTSWLTVTDFRSFSLALLSCSMGTMLVMVLLLWQIIRFGNREEGTKLPSLVSERCNWVGSSDFDIRKGECTVMINAKRSDMKMLVLRFSLGPLHYNRSTHNKWVSA